MKKEGNINFYNVFIEFYKFSVTEWMLFYPRSFATGAEKN